MSDKPLVTIIIPTYNRKDRLIKALNSVLKQDYENIELIVSDNASEDGTHLLMEEYANKYKNIKYIRREKNIGPVFNFLESYKIAMGKYFTFLPDDDYFVSNTYIKNAVNAFEENENISVVRGIAKVLYEKEEKFVFPQYASTKITKGIDYFFYYHKSTEHMHIEGYSGLLRKDIIDEFLQTLNPYTDQLLFDTELYLYSFLKGDVYFLSDEVAGCFLVHGNQISNQSSILEKFDEMINPYKQILYKAIELYPNYEKEKIQHTVERHIYDQVIFKLNAVIKQYGKEKAYHMIKESNLVKEFPNLLIRLKPKRKLDFNLLSIYKDEKYFKFSILGIQASFKLRNKFLND